MENNENPFKLLGNQIKTNVPHLTIGNNGLNIEKPNHENLAKAIETKREDLFNTREQDIIKNLKKWGLIIAVTVIVCYAAYRLIA